MFLMTFNLSSFQTNFTDTSAVNVIDDNQSQIFNYLPKNGLQQSFENLSLTSTHYLSISKNASQSPNLRPVQAKIPDVTIPKLRILRANVFQYLHT
ncbi:CLUMA_CG008150, isoform A [Clunio marinus]|uniref:CLUMA_CG008150, isoform A n=1 Tax=Clunio marinus TaxID=568069 RepID=A0A1J1I4G5_9DIPT|nr:CLUMA_CG008150, isoform A [Clunio marinus]